PLYEIPGIISFGASDRLNAGRLEHHAQISESFQATNRNHSWNVGVDAQWIALNADLRNRFAGVFLFPNLDEFVPGTPHVYVQACGDPRTRQVTVPAALWVHDRWQPRAGLTLDMGARYDTQRLPSPALPWVNNIAPRAGIAWQPKGAPGWVFRAG